MCEKTTFPDRFPLNVFATARRRLRAAVRNASAIVTRGSLSGYSLRVRMVHPRLSE
jgi:hypothetical protein